MSSLSYAAPTSVDDAVKLLAGASGLAKVLSGGTDLLVQLRSGRLKPDLIVDTKKIPGMIGIRAENGGFIIGAATPGAVVEAHAGLNAAWPGLVEALDLIGSTQIQGRCSLAGNLCNASPAADSVPALFAAGATAVIVGSKGSAKCRSSRFQQARAARHSRRTSSSLNSSCRRVLLARPTPICGSFRALKWTSQSWAAAST